MFDWEKIIRWQKAKAVLSEPPRTTLPAPLSTPNFAKTHAITPSRFTC